MRILKMDTLVGFYFKTVTFFTYGTVEFTAETVSLGLLGIPDVSLRGDGNARPCAEDVM
jgi:hypothetical protein